MINLKRNDVDYMRLFYCPKCHREQKLTFNPYKEEETIINIRDGYGRPIRNYRCECGYYLAGSMYISGHDESDILYAKNVISLYSNLNSDSDSGYVISSFSLPNTNLYEQAKAAYERSHQK